MSAMDQNPVGLPETLRAAGRFVPSPVISVIPAVRKTPELVRSTFGEFETRARDEIGDNSQDQDLVWRVGDDRAMLEFLTGAKLLVAVMPRLGRAMHETLSPGRNLGWSCLLIHGLPAGRALCAYCFRDVDNGSYCGSLLSN
jgi:hypothetical protein